MATEYPTTPIHGDPDPLCAELLASQARLAAQLEDTKADLAFFILATAVLEILAIVGILLRAMS